MKQYQQYKENSIPIPIAIMFGGRSCEHEISIITALQAITAIDTRKFKVIPLYIDQRGKWYIGDLLLDKSIYRSFQDNLKSVTEVTLLPDPSIQGLVPIKNGKLLLDAVIPIEVYFLAFHGQYGEDGCIQGLLELANAAYTGSGVMASSTTMNKYSCKMFLKSHGIPVLPAVTISHQEMKRDLNSIHSAIDNVESLRHYPLFVKPCHLGSSIAIGKADNRTSLNSCLAKVFKYDQEAMIEPCIQNLLEINVAILEGDPPIASVVEIPIPTLESLTYEDKYLLGGDKTGGGMASLTRLINPQKIPSSLKQQVTEYALKAFQLLKCQGVARLDFMFDQTSHELYFNELNSLPGSCAFYLWEKSEPRLLYHEVIERMIDAARKRKVHRSFLQRDFGFKALQ